MPAGWLSIPKPKAKILCTRRFFLPHYRFFMACVRFRFVCCQLSGGKFILAIKHGSALERIPGAKNRLNLRPVFVSGQKPETISIHLTIKTELILNQIVRRASMQTYKSVSSSSDTNDGGDGGDAQKTSTFGRISHKISVHSDHGSTKLAFEDRHTH